MIFKRELKIQQMRWRREGDGDMSPIMLFIVLLLVGILSFKMRSKAEGKSKTILTIVGIIACVIGVFGLLTAFL